MQAYTHIYHKNKNHVDGLFVSSPPISSVCTGKPASQREDRKRELREAGYLSILSINMEDRLVAIPMHKCHKICRKRRLIEGKMSSSKKIPLIYFFRFKAKKIPYFSLSFALSEYERRTLVKRLCGRCLSVWGPESNPPPLHTVYVYTLMHIWVNTCHKVPLQVIFLDDDNFFGIYTVNYSMRQLDTTLANCAIQRNQLYLLLTYFRDLW